MWEIGVQMEKCISKMRSGKKCMWKAGTCKYFINWTWCKWELEQGL